MLVGMFHAEFAEFFAEFAEVFLGISCL